MSILKGTVSAYGIRTKLFPLQTGRNYAAHGEHGCRSAHRAPWHIRLYAHIMPHIQQRVRIPNLFPVKKAVLQIFTFLNEILVP